MAVSVETRCHHCDSRLVEYRHGITKTLCRGLRALYRKGGGPIRVAELGLDHSAQANFQKLRYWNFVTKPLVNGRETNEWQITDEGVAFLRAETPAFRWVWTYRGKWQRWDGDLIGIREVVDWVETISDFRVNSRPVRKAATLPMEGL